MLQALKVFLIVIIYFSSVGCNPEKDKIDSEEPAKKEQSEQTVNSSVSSNFNLAGFDIQDHVFDQKFSINTQTYQLSVDNTVSDLLATISIEDENAKLYINGQKTISSSEINLQLVDGENIFHILVVAENGDTGEYQLTVMRGAASDPEPSPELSNNADLTSIEINNVSLNQIFNADQLQYNANVSSSIDSVEISAVLSDSSAILSVNQIVINSGELKTHALNIGTNNIVFLIRAEDGSQKLYSLTVNREHETNPVSDNSTDTEENTTGDDDINPEDGTTTDNPQLATDASLSDLKITGVPLSSVFSSSTYSYTAVVANMMNSISIVPTLNDTNASVTVDGLKVISSASYNNNINVGLNTVSLLVTAEDGATTQEYILQITRSTAEVIGTPATGTAVAIPMKYYVMKNRQKFIALSAYSDDITYRQASYTDTEIDFGVRYRDAITSWNIQSLPNDGDLYDGYTHITSVPRSVSDPDELLYVPNSDYVGADNFTFTVQDSTGESNVGTISLLVESSPSIPAGIAELPDIFSTPAPTPATTGDEESVDWYIDNTHPQATDTARAGESSTRHGTPETPRMSIPPSGSLVEAGAAMFIAGGVNTPYSLRTNQSWHRWILAGTSTNPVYIIGINNGANKPIIEHNGTQLRLEMEYAIIEGVHFKGRLNQRNQLSSPAYMNGNIVMRHNIIDGMNLGTTGSGVSMNYGNTKVFFDVHIKDAGFTEPDLAEENDVHGIQISNVTDYWLIDNLIHDSAGDSIQINGENAHNIYIGRNKLHSDNENAMDFKRRSNLLFMENDVWDYRAISYGSSGSDGAAVIINQDTTVQTPTYSTIARNRIWDANTAVRHQGEYIWTTDNMFWNIHGNVNSSGGSYTIDVGNNGEANYHDRITNNTFHKIDGGIYLWAGNNGGVKEHIYTGNIFGEFNAASTEKMHYRISSNHDDWTILDYNLYMTPMANMWATSNPDNAIDMDIMRATTSNGDNSLNNTDPLFVNASMFDLRLQSTSSAIGANIEQPSYSEFASQYPGKDIQYDLDLNSRPANGSWDIGAYEQ